MSDRFRVEFPYIEFEGRTLPASKRRVTLYRPIIQIILLYGKRLVQYEALLDSGADYNIFPSEIAIFLGIKLTSGSKRNISGIGGRIKGYEHRLDLKVSDYVYKAPVVFSSRFPANTFGVMGNVGFFDRFKVQFNYGGKIFEISR